MPTCLCTAPAGTAHICKRCAHEITTTLERIPFLISQLEIVTTRQARYGTPTDGSRSSITPLPFHAAASQTRIKLQAALETVAVALIHDTCPASPQPAIVARWLVRHVNDLRHHHDAHHLTRTLMQPAQKAETLIDRPADRWYAGPCNAETDGQECGRELYAQTGAAIVECPTCHWQHDVALRRAWLLDAVEDHLANAATIARAVTWLSDTPVTPQRITNWVNRKRLIARGQEPYTSPANPDRTRPLYRVGDVLDLLDRT